MGHVNRHRRHGSAGCTHEGRGCRKRLVEQRKGARRRRKLARARDRERIRSVEERFGTNFERMCTSKRYYCSRDSVERSMRYLQGVFGERCYGYHCPVCGGWHISTHEYHTNESFCVEV